MQPRANLADHRYSAGDKVEYGSSSPHGGDRLGEIVFERREYGQDGYLIRPLNITPGDGTLPSVYPGRMVSDYQSVRWAYDQNGWHRTYAEIRRQATCPDCGCEPGELVRDDSGEPVRALIERDSQGRYAEPRYGFIRCTHDNRSPDQLGEDQVS